MSSTATAVVGGGSTSKTPTKAAAPPVPTATSTRTGASTSVTSLTTTTATTSSKQAATITSGSTPSLPPRAMKTSMSMDTGKDLQSMTVSSATASSAACPPSVTIAVDDEDISTVHSPVAGTIKTTDGGIKVASAVHFPLTATVSLGTAEGPASATTIVRPVGPTPLPRTKRGPSKRGGQSEANKATPRRNFSKINRKGSSHLSDLHRPCLQHSFITEATDVQEMEQGLLHLLDDFHSGNLKAFVKDCSFEKMDNVREQQERLARLHFDLGTQQEAYGTLSEEGQLVAKDHLAKLMTQLQELSTAIEQLQSSTSIDGHQESQR